MKYSEWLNLWLENYVKPNTKKRTYSRYAEIVNQHLNPRIGEIGIEKLTPLDLQRVVTELLEDGNLKTSKGLSVNSVNSIMSVVRISLKAAITAGVITDNAGDKVRRPKPAEKKVTCFTLNEQKKIEQSALKSDNGKMIGVILCLYTGLRIGELLALEWSDIDFVKCELFVTKTSHDTKDENGEFCRSIDKPKTASSNRVIPLPRQIIPVLKAARQKSAGEYVVCSKKGNGLYVRSYQQTYKRLLKTANVPYKNFHSLRHTFATRALECGMDVKTLSEILGHKSPTITLNRYVHSLMEHKKEMMNKLGKLF